MIGGFSWADLVWFAALNVRLRVSDYSQLSDCTIQLQLYSMISEKWGCKCTNKLINQELWLNLDRSRPHERIVWSISPKSSKKLKKDDFIDFDRDFGDAGSFTEILGITVILTDAPASNCGSGLLQSLRRVTYISDASKKDKTWSQMDKKGKNIRLEEERGSWCWWRGDRVVVAQACWRSVAAEQWRGVQFSFLS